MFWGKPKEGEGIVMGSKAPDRNRQAHYNLICKFLLDYNTIKGKVSGEFIKNNHKTESGEPGKREPRAVCRPCIDDFLFLFRY